MIVQTAVRGQARHIDDRFSMESMQFGGLLRRKGSSEIRASRVLDLSVSQVADFLFQSRLTGTTKSAELLSQTRFLPRRCRRSTGES